MPHAGASIGRRWHAVVVTAHLQPTGRRHRAEPSRADDALCCARLVGRGGEATRPRQTREGEELSWLAVADRHRSLPPIPSHPYPVRAAVRSAGPTMNRRAAAIFSSEFKLLVWFEVLPYKVVWFLNINKKIN